MRYYVEPTGWLVTLRDNTIVNLMDLGQDELILAPQTLRTVNDILPDSEEII